MICPRCGRDLVQVEGQRYCSFCGHELETPTTIPDESKLGEPKGNDTEPELLKELPLTQDRYCAWEDQENLGFSEGILRTLKESLFNPHAFFSRLPDRGGFLLPVLYALIVETVGSLVSYAWAFSWDQSWLGMVKFPGFWAIVAGMLVPILVLVRVVISTMALHVSLFLVGGANKDFEATFRVVCYSSGPELFNAVPVVGWAVALVWEIYLTVVGIQEVHGTTTARALAAVLLPVILCCGLIFTAILVAGIGWGLAGVSS